MKTTKQPGPVAINTMRALLEAGGDAPKLGAKAVGSVVGTRVLLRLGWIEEYGTGPGVVVYAGRRALRESTADVRRIRITSAGILGYCNAGAQPTTNAERGAQVHSALEAWWTTQKKN
jgi:hypothetical protein